MGYTDVVRGTIAAGDDITRMPPHRRASPGWAGWRRSGRSCLLDVEENFIGVATGTLGPGGGLRVVSRLEERRGSRGNHLSGGEQQMLAIARADDQSRPAPARRAARGSGADHRRGADRGDPANDRRSGNRLILVEQHAEVALSLTEDAIVPSGDIVHRARSRDRLADHVTLDRLIGLQLAEQPRRPADRQRWIGCKARSRSRCSAMNLRTADWRLMSSCGDSARPGSRAPPPRRGSPAPPPRASARPCRRGFETARPWR